MRSAWLIELKIASQPVWWKARSSCPLGNWTCDANRATNFSRREDAQTVIDEIVMKGEPTSHGFYEDDDLGT